MRERDDDDRCGCTYMYACMVVALLASYCRCTYDVRRSYIYSTCQEQAGWQWQVDHSIMTHPAHIYINTYDDDDTSRSIYIYIGVVQYLSVYMWCSVAASYVLRTQSCDRSSQLVETFIFCHHVIMISFKLASDESKTTRNTNNRIQRTRSLAPTPTYVRCMSSELFCVFFPFLN